MSKIMTSSVYAKLLKTSSPTSLPEELNYRITLHFFQANGFAVLYTLSQKYGKFLNPFI